MRLQKKLILILSVCFISVSCKTNGFRSEEVQLVEPINIIFPDTVAKGEEVSYTFDVYVSGCWSYASSKNVAEGDSVIILFYQKRPPINNDVACTSGFFLEPVVEKITFNSIGEKSLIFNDSVFVKKVIVNP